MLIGGIEAGGTKMVCAVAEVSERAFAECGGRVGQDVKILDRVSIPTEEPEKTLSEMAAYFKRWKVQALGIGCFGPVDLNRRSATYGHITSTPKLAWKDCDMVGIFEKELHVPVGFDTDVNGAILGEVTWGAAKGCESAIYITVGTGVGIGVYCNGGLLHGLVHPEAGHVLLTRHPEDTYKGHCPFHENCVEGLAAGPAIEERWGDKAYRLVDRKEVWELEAYYIAQAVADYILAYSPEKIILWGGVMHVEQLFPMVRGKVQELLNGYVKHPMIQENMEDYIVPPALGDDPGILGAVRLGMLEYENKSK